MQRYVFFFFWWYSLRSYWMYTSNSKIKQNKSSNLYVLSYFPPKIQEMWSEVLLKRSIVKCCKKVNLIAWKSSRTVPKILNIYSQKWNCAVSSQFTFMYLGVIYMFPQSVLSGMCILLYCLWELLAQPQERRKRKGTVRAVDCHQAEVDSSSLPSRGWAESSHKWPTYKFPI